MEILKTGGPRLLGHHNKGLGLPASFSLGLYTKKCLNNVARLVTETDGKCQQQVV